MKVGFIGLGRMGRGIAANLLKAGHEVVVYNRTPARPRNWWRRARAKRHRWPRLAVAMSCSPCSRTTRRWSRWCSARAALSPAWASRRSMSLPARSALHLSERLTEAHAKAGQAYVAAPVFGRPDAAAAAKLFIAAAGPEAALKTVAPLFEVIGQRAFVLSDKPSAANLVKLSGNFLIASVIESLGEAMALVGKGGVDLHAYLDLLTSSLFSAPVYKTYGGLIADSKFEPAGFAAPLGQKDIRLTLAAAENLQVPMPLASLLRDRFLTLMANGGENLDWSAIGKLAAKDSGQSKA